MAAPSELGPVDPQIIGEEDGQRKIENHDKGKDQSVS